MMLVWDNDVQAGAQGGETAQPPSKHLTANKMNRRGQDAQKDRKSTRLNSSHANISYAVFCLKKKIISLSSIYSVSCSSFVYSRTRCAKFDSAISDVSALQFPSLPS